MSIVKPYKPYSVFLITHRITGCYHLVVTALRPQDYKIAQLVAYMNEMATRTHKINNYALREFAMAHRPLTVDDFDLRTLAYETPHGEAKAKALVEAMRLGTSKLLTAHLVKPVLWELNLAAKLRMQNGLPSPYAKASSTSYGPESTGPLTPEQKLLLESHPCNGMSLEDALEEIKFHEGIIKNSSPTDRACMRSVRVLAEVRQYFVMQTRLDLYGVSDTITLTREF